MKKELPEEHSLDHRICHATYSSLKSLIESCYYSQIRWAQSSDPWGSLTYSKEVCTVKMTCSRRSGHTTAIARVVPEYFNRVLLLSPKRVMIEHLKSAFTNIYSELQEAPAYQAQAMLSPVRANEQSRLITDDSEYVFAGLGSLKYLRGYQFEAVVVDVASMLTDKQVLDIYEELWPSMVNFKEKFFIFVE